MRLFAIIPQSRAKVKMRKFEIKRTPGSLPEPANPSTYTSSTDRKVPVLETLAEIVGLLTILSAGWILYVVF